MARRKLGELLVEAGVIDVIQLQSALGEQKKWGRPLGQTLVEFGFLAEETLVRTLSTQLNIPAVDLYNTVASPEALQKLDLEFCQENFCFPFGFEPAASFLDVAMVDPTNVELFDLIRVRTRCNVRPHLAGHRAMDAAIRRDYLGQAPAPAGIGLDNRPWYGQEADFAAVDRPSPLREPAKAQPEPAKAQSEPAPPRSRPRTAERPAVSSSARDQLLMQLHETVRQLVANLERDENVLRKLMTLMVEKGLCTRAEIVAKIYKD